jgi:Nif-specific regulatory protein
MMQAKASSLLLLDHKTRKLYFKVATGEKREEIMKYEIGMGQGIAGFVAQNGEPLLVQDVSRDPRWFKQISDSIGFNTQSIACVPMKVDNETIGVVEIIDKEDGNPLGEQDLKILTVFAELAARAINNARTIDRVRKENRDLKEALVSKYRIIGNSEALKRVLSDAYKVANSRTSTLVLGESGTGKELLARAIHRAGPRREMPLIALNCAALPESLLETELFGHERGAFTGAVGRKMGKFELADKGTLFLDEICEMTPAMQAKLLRVLEEGAFYRIGGDAPIHVDVRVISATNKNIEREVTEGRFREDLYYRLNVVQIRMPPLRERREDIPLLAEHFLESFRREHGRSIPRFSEEAVRKIIEYDWPGNVRELRNAVERAVVMSLGREILPRDLPITALKGPEGDPEVGLTLKDALDRFKKDFIVRNLKHTSGNKSKAAKIMGIQRTYLSRLITKYRLAD